ncbi:MAG: Non-specific serine/threonine protein kinase [Acidobacteriota bacterium]|nr:Non-specific serine/threonine protein kinase [Acidobacteriota bacterium]
MIGSRLAHYRILEKLGEGGMGIVFLAEDERLHRKVALKTLPPALAEDPQRLARFEREVKTVAALNHPNIVTIYSVEEADGKRFFTMEHVEGKTLSQSIPQGGLPLQEFLKIAVPLADALAAAHAKGIQHRDLKPGNVMVNADGRVKVLDFGLAKLREHDATEAMGFHPQTTLTQEGLAIGTLAYMAPEQLRMLPTDHRADLFSLGVVLYEMATGHCPFLGQSTAEVISAILRDQPARSYEQNEKIPPEIDAILRRCLEKEPAKRIGTAVEVRDALAEVARAIDLGQTQSRAPMSESGAVKIVKSRYARFGVAALAIILLGAGALAWRARTLRSAAMASTPPTLATPAAAKAPSLVVLPLSNFANEPEYFVDGMTDALISALSRIRGVRVISRQSAMHYKDSKKLLPEIAKELGVDFVVEGSVTRSADRVRLNAQVIQAVPETTLWSESFERAAVDVIALQNTFASAIASAIDVQLSPVEQNRLAATTAVDPDVYEAYLQGKYFGGQFGEASVRKAKGYFERAIAKDPSFAPAWAGLADALQWLALFHVDPAQLMPQAETAARRAIELDGGLAEAHASLSEVYMNRWDWAGAEAAIQRAIELNPGSAAARRRHWLLLVCQLRLDEALKEIELARRLDPLSAQVSANVGVQYLFLGRHADAIAELGHALELDPDYALTHVYLFLTYSELKKDPERGLELQFYIADLAGAELLPEYNRRLGRDGYESALHWLATTLDANPPQGEASRFGVIAGLLAQAGEREKALTWLERGVEKRAWDMGFLAVAPDYRNLRSEPRFAALLEKIGLPTSAPANLANAN